MDDIAVRRKLLSAQTTLARTALAAEPQPECAERLRGRWIGSGSIGRVDPSRRSRLIRKLFAILARGEMRLDESRLRYFAGFCGFKGGDHEWEADYRVLRTAHPHDRYTGASLHDFAKMVDDAGSFAYLSTAELSHVLLQVKSVTQVRQVVSHGFRNALLRAVFFAWSFPMVRRKKEFALERRLQVTETESSEIIALSQYRFDSEFRELHRELSEARAAGPQKREPQTVLDVMLEEQEMFEDRTQESKRRVNDARMGILECLARQHSEYESQIAAIEAESERLQQR